MVIFPLTDVMPRVLRWNSVEKPRSSAARGCGIGNGHGLRREPTPKGIRWTAYSYDMLLICSYIHNIHILYRQIHRYNIIYNIIHNIIIYVYINIYIYHLYTILLSICRCIFRIVNQIDKNAMRKLNDCAYTYICMNVPVKIGTSYIFSMQVGRYVGRNVCRQVCTYVSLYVCWFGGYLEGVGGGWTGSYISLHSFKQRYHPYCHPGWPVLELESYYIILCHGVSWSPHKTARKIPGWWYTYPSVKYEHQLG